MRHAILVLMLAAQVLAFGLIAATDFSHAGGKVMHFLAYLNDAMLDSAPLIVITLAMGATVAAGTIDLSLVALAALAGCVMARFDGGASFYYAAMPTALALTLLAGALHGAAVGRSPWRAVVVTLIAAVTYRAAALAMRGDAPAPFGLVPGYDRIAAVPVSLLFIVGCGVIVGGVIVGCGWSGRVIEPRARIAACALAAALATAAAVLHTSYTGDAEPTGVVDGTVLALCGVALAGGFRRSGAAGGGALLLGALNVAVFIAGARTLKLRLALSEAGPSPIVDSIPIYLVPVLVSVLLVALDRRRPRDAERPGLASPRVISS